MAKYETNPDQIVKIDGKNCFLEVMDSSFQIGKVRINFRQYNMNAQQGSRTTGKIDIYMSFKDFNYLYQGITHNGNGYLLGEIFNSQYGTTIYRGGKRKGNEITAKELKLQQGQKKPFVMIAEQGPGSENKMGGFSIIRSGNNQTIPSIQKIMIPLELKDIVHMCEATKDRLIAFLTAQEIKKSMDFEFQKTKDLLYNIALRVGCNRQTIENIINREPPRPQWSDNGENNNNQNNEYGTSGGYQNNDSGNCYQNNNNYVSNGYDQNAYNSNGGNYEGGGYNGSYDSSMSGGGYYN